jgi:hypothetical protein
MDKEGDRMASGLKPDEDGQSSDDESAAFERRAGIYAKRVRLPDGRQGFVYLLERDVGGCRQVASIDIEGAKGRLFGWIKPRPVRVADEEIDTLVVIPTEREIQDILNDPTQLGLEP